MSDQFSRREFFAFLVKPIARAQERARANEQRMRRIEALRQAAPPSTRKCARCYAPLAPEHDELHCPACTELAAKDRGLLAELK